MLPVAGEYGAILGAYVDGGYGFPGLYYLAGNTILWFMNISLYGDEDTVSDETSAKADDTKVTDGADSDDSGTQDLTDISGVGGKQAETLNGAVYSTHNDVEKGSQSELADVVGDALAAQAERGLGASFDSAGGETDLENSIYTSEHSAVAPIELGKRGDRLARAWRRKLDTHRDELQRLDSGERLPIRFRHHNLVPASSVKQ